MQGKKHSSAHYATLLFVVIFIWKKLKMKPTGEKAINCTLQNCLLLKFGLERAQRIKDAGEKAFQCKICNTDFCHNLNLKENEEWNIQGKDHSSAHCATLLAFVIWIRKNPNNQRYSTGEKHSSTQSATLLFVQFEFERK